MTMGAISWHPSLLRLDFYCEYDVASLIDGRSNANCQRFYYLIENDLLYKHVEDGDIRLTSIESNVEHKSVETLETDAGEVIDQKINPE